MLSFRCVWQSVVLAVVFMPSAMALELEDLPYPLKSRMQKPIQLEKKTQTLEEFIGRTDIPYSFVQPVSLNGVKIAGLNTKAIQVLGENYFVVVSNTNSLRMGDLYRENRVRGKSNYVTVDCVLHPYLAFVNRIYADLICRYMLPMTKTFLMSLLQVAIDDYKQADDADVRSDIECNIAFFCVALKLADSNFKIPDIGRVSSLVQSDLESIASAKKNKSAILEREEDFSLYEPVGWYRSNSELASFYRIKTWLARLTYPVHDVEFVSAGVKVNYFRRSVLLYRNLELAQVNGKPAFDLWVKLVRSLFLLGSQIENWQDKNLYPQDYKSVFKANSTDLKVTLSALAEPLYRTKLLLAVRRQKPLNIGSTSIFDIDNDIVGNEAKANFHLFPNIGYPEEPWLRARADSYPKAGFAAPLFPAALVDLNVWGAAQAGNILLDSSWALDPGLARALVDLKKYVSRRLPAGQVQTVSNKLWSMLTPYFLLSDTGQSLFRTEIWSARRLESAFSGWLDSMVNIAPAVDQSSILNGANPKELDNKNNNPHVAAGVSPANLARGKQTAVVRRVAHGHYVDPNPQAFQKLESDALQLENEITALEFSTGSYQKRLSEFIRLFQRLKNIAQEEVAGSALSSADLQLLGNIDLILDKIDVPLPAVLSFGCTDKDNIDTAGDIVSGGYSMILGRPGLLYVILQNRSTAEWTLARGAVYTYYETPGSHLSCSKALTLLDRFALHPPYWTEKFDIIVR